MASKYPYLDTYLNKYKTFIFFDFEATAFTHMPIELSMVFTSFNNYHFNIIETYSTYIKTDDTIGKYVTELTGIDKDILDKNGVAFINVINNLATLFSKYPSKLFLSYSKNDLAILKNAIDSKDLKQEQIKLLMLRNFLDAQKYLARLIRDENGNILSLKKLSDYLNITQDFKFHSASDDSIAMVKIFNAYFNNYEKILTDAFNNFKNLPIYKRQESSDYTEIEIKEILKEQL